LKPLLGGFKSRKVLRFQSGGQLRGSLWGGLTVLIIFESQ
jgi:hypothetical protein